MGESDLIFSRTSAWELGEKMKKMKMGGREGRGKAKDEPLNLRLGSILKPL